VGTLKKTVGIGSKVWSFGKTYLRWFGQVECKDRGDVHSVKKDMKSFWCLPRVCRGSEQLEEENKGSSGRGMKLVCVLFPQTGPTGSNSGKKAS